MSGYYSCDWIIDAKTARFVYKARDLIDNLRGELAILRVPFQENEAGLSYTTFGARFPHMPH
jgi:hypothetical protein